MKKKPIILIFLIIIVTTAYILFPKGKINYSSGRVEATEIELSTKYAGKVLKIYKREGEKVEKGEILLEIDARELKVLKEEINDKLNALQFEKKSFEIEIENLKEDLEKTKKLMEIGALSEREYEKMKTKYNSLLYKIKSVEENIESIKKNLERLSIQEEEYIIKSPVKGIIIEKNIEVGELTKPGFPLFRIANLDTLFVYAYLPQKELYDLNLSKTVKIIPHTDKKIEFTGKVVWISEEAEFTPKNVITPDEKALLVFKFKIKVINRDNLLKPGMTVSVYYK
ncbi:MAG: efflux RND transporter periplasmic adaptor subunit [candidate division WOR-3 bacterium]